MKGAGLRFASRSAKWAAIIVHARFSVGREMRQDLSFAAVAFLLMCSHAAHSRGGNKLRVPAVFRKPKAPGSLAGWPLRRTAGLPVPFTLCRFAIYSGRDSARRVFFLDEQCAC